MTRAAWFVALTGAVVGGAMIVTPVRVVAAHGGDYRCNNQTLTGMTISSNLVVPSGAFCDLSGSHITGSATVQPNGGLLSDSASKIDGDVQVQKKAQFTQLNGSTVGGDVQCDRCAVADSQDSSIGGDLEDYGISQGAFLRNNHIGGDLHIDHGAAVANGPFDIQGNTVGGNLVFNHNNGPSTISTNVITKSLECQGNQPPPAGAGNTAAQKKGQCANL